MAANASTAKGAATPAAQTTSYERFAGLCAILAGVVGFVYSLSFIVLRNDLLTALCLMLGGLLASAAVVAVYRRLWLDDISLALWATLLAMFGAFGAAIHGGYDLANAINPPATLNADLPNPVDPRGLLTFGVAGLGFLALSWMMGRSGRFPGGLANLGYLLGVLLLIIYGGRLIIQDPANLIIAGPALLAGFVVNPLWYIWLGLTLRRKDTM